MGDTLNLKCLQTSIQIIITIASGDQRHEQHQEAYREHSLSRIKGFFLFQSQKRQIFHAMLVAKVGKKGIVAQRANCHIEYIDGNTDRVVYRSLRA